MSERSEERSRFLANLLHTAIACGSYGFPELVGDYVWEGDPADSVAVIIDRYLEPDDEGYGVEHRITVDTMAAGLSVIRNAQLRVAEQYPQDGPVPHNAKTGERLYFGGRAMRDLLLADRTNGDDGDYDVLGALAVLECALFGCVRYA